MLVTRMRCARADSPAPWRRHRCSRPFWKGWLRKGGGGVTVVARVACVMLCLNVWRESCVLCRGEVCVCVCIEEEERPVFHCARRSGVGVPQRRRDVRRSHSRFRYEFTQRSCTTQKTLHATVIAPSCSTCTTRHNAFGGPRRSLFGLGGGICPLLHTRAPPCPLHPRRRRCGRRWRRAPCGRRRAEVLTTRPPAPAVSIIKDGR